MEKKYEEKISEARRVIAQTQEEALEDCFNRIRMEYDTLNERQRREVLNGLERLTDKMKYKIRSFDFDGEKARVIRQKEGLSQKALAKILEPNKRHRGSYIARYEKGQFNPNPNTELSRKYFQWLKDHGY